jgi:hypothetical protein
MWMVKRWFWRSFAQTLKAEEAGRTAINSCSEQRLLHFLLCLAFFLPFALALPSGHIAIAIVTHVRAFQPTTLGWRRRGVMVDQAEEHAC